jgi:hypothetical protein
MKSITLMAVLLLVCGAAHGGPEGGCNADPTFQSIRGF